MISLMDIDIYRAIAGLCIIAGSMGLYPRRSAKWPTYSYARKIIVSLGALIPMFIAAAGMVIGVTLVQNSFRHHGFERPSMYYHVHEKPTIHRSL